MEPAQRQAILSEVQRLWDAGQGYEAGKLFFEYIPLRLRKDWVVSIVELCAEKISPVPEIEAIIDLAQNDEKWGFEPVESIVLSDAHHVINNLWVLLESADSVVRVVGELILNICKTIYNSRGYRALFDHNAAWYVVENLYELTQLLNDAEFTDRVEKCFMNAFYLQLDEPVVCNPGCPFCMQLYPEKWQEAWDRATGTKPPSA